MCECSSCKATNKYVEDHRDSDDRFIWPDVDPVKLAKYQRSKAAGKIPADPAYAAHVRACLTWQPHRGAVREFTAAELRDTSVKVYKRTASEVEVSQREAPDREFPPATVTDVAEYVRQFEALNHLTPVKD